MTWTTLTILNLERGGWSTNNFFCFIFLFIFEIILLSLNQSICNNYKTIFKISTKQQLTGKTFFNDPFQNYIGKLDNNTYQNWTNLEQLSKFWKTRIDVKHPLFWTLWYNVEHLFMKLLQPAGETPNNVTATILKTRKHFFSIFGDNFKFWWSSERFLLQRFSFFFWSTARQS